MISDLALFTLIFVAIGVGWWLGRRAGVQAGSSTDAIGIPSQYYRGLNYLLDDQPDGAIDAFIDALEVNSDTFDTHIALGNLLRRRGETDRAIRIHQNLLSRPDAPPRQLHTAHLELARDYISAGLLDRAERLLLDLVRESTELANTSRKHLLQIYESEREWEQAIEVAQEMLPRKSLLPGSVAADKTVLVALSHYCCEMAEVEIAASHLRAARQRLHDALAYDANCVRASMLLGHLELESGHPKLAVKALKRIRFQDPEYIPESVDLLHRCHQVMDDIPGLHDYLWDCMDYYPSVTLMLKIAEDIQSASGDVAAGEFISGELKSRPSLIGLAALIQLHVASARDAARENLVLLQQLVEKLISDRATYRCGHCGFSGRELHWLCPSCKQWSRIKAIRGTQGD